MKISEVDKFKKGLNDKQKKEYVQIVKAEETRLNKEGIGELRAEILAIRKANAMFGDKSKSMEYSELESTQMHIVLSEASPEASKANDFQLVLPIGTTYDDWYGQLIFTTKFMKAMVSNQDSLKITKPFLNEQHDRGKAFAWLSDMRVSNEGLEVKWDFNQLGNDTVEGNIYRYFSSEIGSVTDVDTGESVFPVFRGAALTNSPVMKNMPEVHLQDVIFEENTNGGNEVNFKEAMEALKALQLSDEERKELTETYGEKTKLVKDVDLAEKLVAKEEVIVSLQEKVKVLEESIALGEADKIEAKLTEALDAGKIKPVDKEKWLARLTKDFDEYSEVIDEMAVAVVLDTELGSEHVDKIEVKTHKFEDYSGNKGVGVKTKKDLKDYS